MTLHLSREVVNALSELDLPEYDDVANAPAKDGTFIYVTGDGATTPEGAYIRKSGSYEEVGSGGGGDTEIAVARKTANQSVGTSGSWIGIDFDTENTSKLSGLSSANDNFVPPKDGFYQLDLQVNVNFGNSASTMARIQETTGPTTMSISQLGNGSSSNETHRLFAVGNLTTSQEVVFEIQTNQLGGSSDVGGAEGETKVTVEYLGT